MSLRTKARNYVLRLLCPDIAALTDTTKSLEARIAYLEARVAWYLSQKREPSVPANHNTSRAVCGGP